MSRHTGWRGSPTVGVDPLTQLTEVVLPDSVRTELAAEPGEYPVGHLIGGLRHERIGNGTVSYRLPATVAVGSASFVTGAAVGAVAARAIVRSRARREAMPRWREAPLRQTVPATRRLWCQVADDGGQWLWVHIGYSAILTARLDRRRSSSSSTGARRCGCPATLRRGARP
jgi:hypothetical protein